MNNTLLIIGGISIGLGIGFSQRTRAYKSIINGEPQSFDAEIKVAQIRSAIGIIGGSILVAYVLSKK